MDIAHDFIEHLGELRRIADAIERIAKALENREETEWERYQRSRGSSR